MPRWGRDQNSGGGTGTGDVFLPQCPGGGEIKTAAHTRSPLIAAYHSAPVGARSKPNLEAAALTLPLTTVPRWGRDQNKNLNPLHSICALPQCPGGGEIKTKDECIADELLAYHSAPVGARSKRSFAVGLFVGGLTTVPRWGRDQNYAFTIALEGNHLPQCPGGGEIKTVYLEQSPK